MGQVAFWSPTSGQCGNTSNMMAVATVLGMEYVTRTLVTHTHWENRFLESAFLKGKKTIVNEVEYSNFGIDALEILVRTNRLTPKIVKDYTDSVLLDRLDLLRGTDIPNKEIFGSLQEVIVPILAAAINYYNISLIDVCPGDEDALSKTVLKTSDVIVVNLCQNLDVLQKFYEEERPSFLHDKECVVVIGQYDAHSKYNITNIKRMFRQKTAIYTIPHHTGFMDAINDKAILEFFLRNRKSTHPFFSEVRKLTKAIAEAAGVDVNIYSKEGA